MAYVENISNSFKQQVREFRVDTIYRQESPT